MTLRYHLHTSLLALGLFVPSAVMASPWSEVGDNQLRADISLLGDAGAVNDISGQWPFSWGAILPALHEKSLAGQSAEVQAAAKRVLDRAAADTQPGFSASFATDLATAPPLVYGFDGMGRGDGQAQLTLDYNGERTSARLALGAFTTNFTGRTVKFMPDGSFIAEKLEDDLTVYGGWLSHWWGPGWISALALSNNARPMPQIGIQRAGGASSWPVLNLFGPWQAEFFIGLLDDKRIDRNTGYDALHITFNPLPGLEIGLARTEEICGRHHSCVPLRDTFNFENGNVIANNSNDQGEIDIKWSNHVLGVPAQFYMSLMNEDSSPISHSGTSHLFGVTTFLPMGSSAPLRLTVEYTDSVPTTDIFSFGDVMHGFAYNNYSYVDGMRYRGRSLGFSLDSDSRLLSLQGAWTDKGGRFYELSFHHAAVSDPGIATGTVPGAFNAVTSAPVHINSGEARVGLPWHSLRLDLAARLADDQPRPYSGWNAGGELSLRAQL